MEKWSREEIEEWCHRAETESFFSDAIGGSEIIRQILHQLDEAEATIASLRADIQAGVQDIFMKMYRATGAVCAYCGDRPVDPETHWETCEKHPARKQLDEVEKRVAGECAEIAETHQPQEFSDGCGTGKFIARTIRQEYGIGG